MVVKRGEIYYADLSPVVGSEQGGIRPVLIVQNDVGNRYSPTVIVAAITSRYGKTKLPTHIEIDAKLCGLNKNSVVLLEQMRTLDKSRLKEKAGDLPQEYMRHIDDAIGLSLGLIIKERVKSNVEKVMWFYLKIWNLFCFYSFRDVICLKFSLIMRILFINLLF